MSSSLAIYRRFQHRQTARIVVSILFVALSAVYLSWRLTIFNPEAPVLSALFYGAEVIGLILGLSTILMSMTYRHRAPRPAPAGLSVDVFIPTYQEPVDLVRRTLKAALAIDYPHETWLLDDGNREEMRALAEELGARYLARTENVDAKAGNLNHALAHSSGEFFAVFDADHIPSRRALHILLGLVDDPEVALVQAPQDFYNTTAFQYINAADNGGLWHDQSYFYSIAQSSKEAWNAATCVGTSALYRRSAIEAIGGIPGDTVTEDMHTSLRLHKHGFRTVYVNEPVAYGIAAVDLGEYYKTRLRWGHGNVHALRRENILFCRGLTLRQRLAYLTLGLIYLEGWQQLIMYLVPIYSLLTGIAPFEITLFNVLLMIGYPVTGYLLLQELACGYGRYWLNEMYSMARFPVYIAATFGLVRDRMAWRCSSKALKGRLDWKLMLPQMSVLALSLAALGVGVARNIGSFDLGPLTRLFWSLGESPGGAMEVAGEVEWFAVLERGYNLDLLLIAGFWAVFNVVRCILFAAKAARNVRQSHTDYRFDAKLPIELLTPSGPVLALTEEVSLTAVRLRAPIPPVRDTAEPAFASRARLFVPGGSIAVRIECTRVVAHEGELEVEARIDPVDAVAVERLESALFSVDWHRGLGQREAYFMTPLETLGHVFCGRWGQLRRRRSAIWRPVLYRCHELGQHRRLLAMLRDDSPGDATIVTFSPLPHGASLLIDDDCGVSATALDYSVAEMRRLPGSGAKLLDGTIPYSYRVVQDQAISRGALQPVRAIGARRLTMPSNSALSLRRPLRVTAAESEGTWPEHTP